jgi:hypothetical protein
MNTAGAIELGYASRAILSALMQELIAKKVLSPETASTVLAAAATDLQGAGGYAWVKGAIAVVADMQNDLTPQGVKKLPI